MADKMMKSLLAACEACNCICIQAAHHAINKVSDIIRHGMYFRFVACTPILKHEYNNKQNITWVVSIPVQQPGALITQA